VNVQLYPEITTGVFSALAQAIAISIAESGSRQHEFAARYNLPVHSIAGNGSTQYECAYRVISEVQSAQAFHELAQDYDLYSYKSKTSSYTLNPRITFKDATISHYEALAAWTQLSTAIPGLKNK